MRNKPYFSPRNPLPIGTTAPSNMALWLVLALPMQSLVLLGTPLASCSLAQDLGVPDKTHDKETIRRWVEDLGSSRFDVRDQATGKLSQLSADHLELISEFRSQATDPEVQVRLASVVAKLKSERQQQVIKLFLRETDPDQDHGLLGWTTFSKFAGANRSAKRLFLQLYEHHPELIEKPLASPKEAIEFGKKLARRIQEEDMQRGEGDKSDGLALLYAACVAGDEENASLSFLTLRILMRAPYNQCIRDTQAKRPLEALTEEWVEHLSGGYEQTLAIQILVEANLSTVRTLSLKMIASYKPDESFDAKDLLKAFQGLFLMGKIEDIPLLEEWLDNREVCEEIQSLNIPGGPIPNGQPLPNGQPKRILSTVELRDVALLACMKISGVDYFPHYPTIMRSGIWGFTPRSIALVPGSEAIRQARLEAWKGARKSLPGLPLKDNPQ